MEILQILLSLFAEQYNGGILKPVLSLLKENSFDIKKTLSNLNPEQVAPIIKEFMNREDKKSPTRQSVSGVGLNPIANVADKEIVYTLNKYFHEPTI